MREDHFWCPKCRKRLQGAEVEKREVDTMFGEGRWWFCLTCGSSLATYANQDLDLYSIIVALGERAFNSIWIGDTIECFGENAEELYTYTDHERPIPGADLLRITSGIYQTIEGDLKAFDPGSASHWFYIRAWDSEGFYIETNDPESKESLVGRFQDVEEIEEMHTSYEGLFITVSHPAPHPPALPVQPAKTKPTIRSKQSWDPHVFADHNRKSASLVSAFFLVDSLEAVSKCVQWLSVLKPYDMPDMEHSQYFHEVREIYQSGKQVVNFDYEFRLTWEHKEFQAFLRCHFFDQGRYEIELLLPGIIANEVAGAFKDGKDGFCCAFMPPMFYD